jgi:hypothetical protein
MDDPPKIKTNAEAELLSYSICYLIINH